MVLQPRRVENQGICCEFWYSVVGDWEKRIGGSRQQILLYVKHIKLVYPPDRSRSRFAISESG